MAPGRLAVVLSSDATGLGAVRSLHEGGVRTIAVTIDRWEPVRFSRFAEKRLVPRSPDVECALLDVLRGIREPHRPVLLPTSDFLAHVVAKHRQTLREHFRCCVPPAGAMETVVDKALDTRRLTAAGFPVPRTLSELPSTAEELLEALPLPLIIKPRTFRDKNELGWRNAVLHTPDHVRDFYRSQAHAQGRVIAQELIPGSDDALWECMAVFDEESELRTAFTFRKFRTMPAHYGATSYGRSERNDEIITLVRAIGKLLGYVGPADVDLKFDRRDGTFKYLELNPRLGLCNYFAARCGVNVALEAYRLEAGFPPAPGFQREGRTFLALLEDLGARLQAGDGLPRVIAEAAIALARNPVGPYFAWNDIGPGPMAAARLACRMIERAWRGQLRQVFSRDYARVPQPIRSKT